MLLLAKQRVDVGGIKLVAVFAHFALLRLAVAGNAIGQGEGGGVKVLHSGFGSDPVHQVFFGFVAKGGKPSGVSTVGASLCGFDT